MPSKAASKTPAGRSSLIRTMADQTTVIRQDLLARAADFCEATAASLSVSLARTVLSEEAADVMAQAIACTAPIISQTSSTFSTAYLWLMQQLSDWERFVLARAKVLSAAYSVSSAGSATHLYELLLHRHARSTRKRAGVFFTPEPIADYIVSQADSLLREACGAVSGLAADEAIILDPACGTGVFLLTVIDHVHRRLVSTGDRSGIACWNDLADRMLARLIGIEILPAAALIAKLNVAVKLAETGYGFSSEGYIRIITGNALAAETQSRIGNPKSRTPVVLGNPPFSSLSTNTNDWIARLVRGDDEIRGYVRANGETLRERKTWLHDDYVKFIRLAQWHVETAGAGIVGFVTNHGYLDNATFRLMRQELLRVFPRIDIVDLHGNRKKHEIAPGGERDENVFGLDQGVAIGLFCRPPSTLARSASEGVTRGPIQYADIWGSRGHKLDALRSLDQTPSLALRASVVAPQPPEWRFVPTRNSRRHPEYDAAWSLTDAMPLNATAPVTARDHFVVAFTPQELRDRIEQFRDLSISDDDIRTRFFQRTRSARYRNGDSRGWKLAEARRIIATDDKWQAKIIRCLYRPFDWRYVFWHLAMIDWPRHDVTRHLMETKCGTRNAECGMENNSSEIRNSALRTPHSALCLIARRQQLPTQPCTFFWITDCLALDGVIRSDNRGSESLFPLYVRDEDGSDEDARKPNFADFFIDQFCQATSLRWLPHGRGDRKKSFGPEDVLAYIYALFHCPAYRQRYAEELRLAFPRVIPPTDAASFNRMCHWGAELIALHLLRAEAPPATAGFELPASRLPQAVASFRAGGYVALRKWLQPPHRSTSDPQYERIVAAIGRTVEIMEQIDGCIAAAGRFAVAD